MTIAICSNCGEHKLGALSPCAACKYDPAADPDRRNQAKSLWLSDHHQKPDVLEAIGARMKAGQPVAWDDRVLDQLVVQLQTQQNALHIGKTPVGCSVFVWSVIAIAVALAGLVVFLATYRE